MAYRDTLQENLTFAVDKRDKLLADKNKLIADKDYWNKVAVDAQASYNAYTAKNLWGAETQQASQTFDAAQQQISIINSKIAEIEGLLLLAKEAVATAQKSIKDYDSVPLEKKAEIERAAVSQVNKSKNIRILIIAGVVVVVIIIGVFIYKKINR